MNQKHEGDGVGVRSLAAFAMAGAVACGSNPPPTPVMDASVRVDAAGTLALDAETLLEEAAPGHVSISMHRDDIVASNPVMGNRTVVAARELPSATPSATRSTR